ncbi:uncharacterized protein LOC114166083 isoform X2 [Vigna unguiculata]|uniref:uncharacterized protein LOC114166083 isoform X2 n=1 Tax=Vigna unguiculata TaxID=3917 RepID=UPI0010169B20|nr:uncharacterized protein LOC114166083 isoform X2 [Vigna unguiculata]
MAFNEEKRIPLKYWVNDETKRVSVAEASGELVDVLFSFLTLPLGTIIRLCNSSQQQERRENTSEQQEGHENTSEQQAVPEQQVGLGCINELYKSVNHLQPDVFRNKICQKMLHFPRNPLESSCQRLKVKVDDTEPTKYFMCHNCSRKGSKLLVSSFIDVKCNCGSLMRKEIALLDEAAGDDGVFVKEKAMFFIYDNLTVRQSSPSEFIQAKQKKLQKYKEVLLDSEKILNILKQALTPKPLLLMSYWETQNPSDRSLSHELLAQVIPKII